MSGKGDKGRKGGLKSEDDALWSEVTKSIAPLRVRRGSILPKAVVTSDESRPRPPSVAPRRDLRPQPVAQKPALATIDRRTKQRLSRGTASVEARLDLHGMTQNAARTRLEAFLRSAQARGLGMVLVITGKGGEGPYQAYGEGRGVLRRQVPRWLALPELRSCVVGFTEAGIGHGGAGALYVRIRRKRLP